MKLPDVKKRLDDLIVELQALSAEIPRRRPLKKGRITSVSVTPTLRKAVIVEHKINPKKSQAELAKQFGVNPGRVSEILRGKRK